MGGKLLDHSYGIRPQRQAGPLRDQPAAAIVGPSERAARPTGAPERCDRRRRRPTQARVAYRHEADPFPCRLRRSVNVCRFRVEPGQEYDSGGGFRGNQWWNEVWEI
jgi:hypothetical protein